MQALADQFGFNSTLVRSRPPDAVENPNAFFRFNSTLVRSRPVACRSSALQLNQFQFHIGSIKASRGSDRRKHQASFQFHIGSIKAQRACLIDQITFWFQFHIGSIKAVVMIVNRMMNFMFQFHIGSIKALQTVPGVNTELGFNSTLVRSRPLLTVT